VRFILEPGRSIPLPAQLLVVRVQARGAAVPPLVDVLSAASGRPVDGRDLTAAPGMVALAVTEPVTIRIRPAGGLDAFPPHSIVSLNVGAETPDASSVTLPGVDASGLPQRDLVTLTPSGDEVLVTALVESRDAELPPLAAQARVAAREVLGLPRVRAEDAVNLSIVVDTTASMRPLLVSGAVERALELVMGAGQVIGADQPVQAAGCGQGIVTLPPQRLDGFARSVAGAAAELEASTGFRSRLIPRPQAASVTYVVTDAVPADAVPAAQGSGLHLLILSAAAEPAAVGAPPPPGRTYLSPDLPWDQLHQHQVTQLVASLLSVFRERQTGAT
jgi:hypothetical protein